MTFLCVPISQEIPALSYGAQRPAPQIVSSTKHRNSGVQKKEGFEEEKLTGEGRGGLERGGKKRKRDAQEKVRDAFVLVAFFSRIY